MAIKTKTAIGLEVTSSKVKLVEIVSATNGMKITNFAVFDLPSDLGRDARFCVPTKQIRAAFNTKEIYGVVSSPLVEHRIVLLPPMTEKEMNVVTRREAGKLRHGGHPNAKGRTPGWSPSEGASGMSGETALQDVSFGFDVVGRVDIGDIKKTAVLIVTAPYGIVSEQKRTTEDMGICLRGLTIVPLALFHALLQDNGTKSAIAAYSEEGVTAFIYVGINSACIIMVGDNSLLFSREFSFTSGAELTEANYTDRLTVEVKRSLLYFKQRYRGKEVVKGFVSGDMQGAESATEPKSRDTLQRAPTTGMDLGNLAGLLAKELDIGVEVFSLPDGLEVSLPHEKMSKFQGLLPSLTIPIGLAMAGLRQSRINLLSKDGVYGKGIWHMDAILRIASSILLLMLLGSYTWVSISNFYTQRAKLDTLKALESQRPKLKHINLLEGERREHAARLLLVERLKTPSPHDKDWYELLREISWLVPDDIVFNTLETELVPLQIATKQEKEQGQRIIIEGKARTKGGFNKFMSYLQDSSSLSVLSSHQKTTPFPSQSKAEGVHFAIECELRQ